MGGVPDCIDPMWSKAAAVIATTLLDLLTDPAHLEAAQAEFRERTGGGIGGTRWVAPLLPKPISWPRSATAGPNMSTRREAGNGPCRDPPGRPSDEIRERDEA